jgi:hypothetical protein
MEGGNLRESAIRRPTLRLAILALTAMLGSVTDTNCNWDCAYANDFPSQLKTFAQEAKVFMSEVTLVGRLSGIRTQNGPVYS